jgi:hypothetical protein
LFGLLKFNYLKLEVNATLQLQMPPDFEL